MSYELILGDRAYSSWSLRAFLLFDRWGLPCRTRMVAFSADRTVAEQLADLAPADTVPVLVTPEGAIVHDSLAIAEELASRHGDHAFWPADPAARATARTLAAAMHSSFATLRNECPMNLRAAYRDVPVSPPLAADLARLEALWQAAFDRFGGPWLCGEYSVADAFFAPVAARIATYDLPISPLAEIYVARHLADPAFRRWRAMALVAGPDLPWYARAHARRPWPGPAPRAAKATETRGENAACPYSGRPVTHFMELGGRRWGFCNAFCRDKTLADPDAWPAFTAMEADGVR
jgi:glutathione S-transferase